MQRKVTACTEQSRSKPAEAPTFGRFFVEQGR